MSWELHLPGHCPPLLAIRKGKHDRGLRIMIGEDRAVLALLLLTHTDPLTHPYATDVYWGSFEAGVEPGIRNVTVPTLDGSHSRGGEGPHGTPGRAGLLLGTTLSLGSHTLQGSGPQEGWLFPACTANGSDGVQPLVSHLCHPEFIELGHSNEEVFLHPNSE